MTTHFTVRMAWHDSKWDGKVCRDPATNVYCTGSRSLLSDRIARKKDKETEVSNCGKEIDNLLPKYLPPCYYTSAAFSPKKHTVIHQHPFKRFEDTKQIKEELAPYSVFSWPFRLAYNHSKEKRDADGDYKKDLKDRIERFTSRFELGESIVFFYLNYDNPVSGEEEKYALVGFAVVNAKPHVPPSYPFDNDELQEIQGSSQEMKYFPAMNWAIQISYDFEKTGVLLPYHEYLEEGKKHPEKRHLLENIKILIEEKSLVFGFKYVLADIDEDQCILLLTKLRKVADQIQNDGIVDFKRETQLINQLLEKAWNRRGLYPSLPVIIDHILDDDSGKGEFIVRRLKADKSSKEDLCERVFSIFSKSEPAPVCLAEFEEEVNELRRNWVQHSASLDLLKKLSLFNLKRKQLDNIILGDEDSFTKKVTSKEIVKNPYVICEEYKFELSQEDLDDEVIQDGDIDLFKIDIGMFPEKFIKGNPQLQNLASGGPERLRAIIIDYLYFIGEHGDCYSVLEDIYESTLNNPLFYKRDLKFIKDQLLSDEYLLHFKKRLTLKENNGKYFFYLNEAVKAEEIINATVTELLNRPDHDVHIKDIDGFVNAQVEALKQKGLKVFNEEQFRKERTKVLGTLPAKWFYIISGKPGTGKTKVLEKIIVELAAGHEKITVLAPTGKASLRLRLESGAQNAQTIDRFVYSDENNYREMLDDFRSILTEIPEKPIIGNLIIDESSMVDLQKLATVFSMLKLHGEEGDRLERIIMVGDEDQLPPIGFGKPYYDIIQYLKKTGQYRDCNYIKLLTNCRNELDPKIIEFADIFAGKNRYFDELLDQVVSGKSDISEGLRVERWANFKELGVLINQRLKALMNSNLSSEDIASCGTGDDSEKLNLLFGLYSNGFVKKDSCKMLGIENFQLLTPYRTEFFGSMKLSDFIKSTYPRGHWADSIFGRTFNHSDKIIRRANEYVYDLRLHRRVLRLSNGSIGVVNNKQASYRQYYFTDQSYPIKSVGFNALSEDEDLELAYAITVHKAQGSDFKDVFLVIPAKKSLLSKELLYTALTRSKRSMTVFLQKQEGREVLEEARSTSAVLQRKTSIFEEPEDTKGMFEPVKGKSVKSKIEYIIYKTLESNGLDFKYEEPMPLKKGPKSIKPDFTIWIKNDVYYWEHLGELDLQDYWTKWMVRRDWYKANGKIDRLVTSDDLGGVKNEKILEIIQDIKNQKLKETDNSEFSNHHYKLYE